METISAYLLVELQHTADSAFVTCTPGGDYTLWSSKGGHPVWVNFLPAGTEVQ